MISKILGNPTQDSSLSLIDNVVKQKCINRIYIRFYKDTFGGFRFLGSVEFQNNKGTTLTQDFNGNSLADVFIKVKNFCEHLPE